jgi:hypothetical protein
MVSTNKRRPDVFSKWSTLISGHSGGGLVDVNVVTVDVVSVVVAGSTHRGPVAVGMHTRLEQHCAPPEQYAPTASAHTAVAVAVVVVVVVVPVVVEQMNTPRLSDTNAVVVRIWFVPAGGLASPCRSQRPSLARYESA